LGFDLSFTNNKRSDWSSIVVVRVYQGILYVREFIRFRAELDEALRSINLAWQVYGRCPIFSFMSGPEISVARYFAGQSIGISFMPAKDPKFVRARRTIDAHNAGKILYPQNHPTMASTLSRMASFRGVEEDEDDEVDALVSVYEAMVPRGGSVLNPTQTLGRRRV
jgi:phage terminase large subunit-like protein